MQSSSHQANWYQGSGFPSYPIPRPGLAHTSFHHKPTADGRSIERTQHPRLLCWMKLRDPDACSMAVASLAPAGSTEDALEVEAVTGCPGITSDFSTSQKEKPIPTPHTLVATTITSASGIKRKLGDLRLQVEWSWIWLPKPHKLSS